MKNILLIALIFIPKLLYAQECEFADNIDFNGYIQIRSISDFDDYTSFSVRRLKLWLKSKPEFSKHWSYKIQTTFSSFTQEKFFLQDVKVKYEIGLFSFDIGQFVPQYSLQRFQPDYKIASIERAKVINVLIPDGTLGVRDIGVQVNFKNRSNLFETHLGIFNGYGIKEYRFNNHGYMITHKSSFQIPINKNTVRLGYSLQYRYAENIMLKSILPDTVLFTGNDFRYNLFAIYRSKIFEIQAEYLTADLEGQRVDGYYVLSTINFKKNQIVLSYETFNDLINETLDKQYCRLGYNYLIKRHKMKLSFDNYFQLNDNKIKKYLVSIQLQIFFI